MIPSIGTCIQEKKLEKDRECGRDPPKVRIVVALPMKNRGIFSEFPKIQRIIHRKLVVLGGQCDNVSTTESGGLDFIPISYAESCVRLRMTFDASKVSVDILDLSHIICKKGFKLRETRSLLLISLETTNNYSSF